MNPPLPDRSQLEAGAARLARPLLPLVRLLQLLYLTAPVTRIEQVLALLDEPLETAGVSYREPGRELAPYLEILQALEALKRPDRPSAITVLDEAGRPLSRLEALERWVCHAVLNRELETINSLLCAPCRCTLCCTGPAAGMRQQFFEIPLSPAEAALFPLPRIDSRQSRAGDSTAEPPLLREGRQFYRTGAALYHWRNGWSMILPVAGRCPQLDEQGGCRIYPRRPRICRLPQIFSYLLEEQPGEREQAADQPPSPPIYLARNKLLAVWDCPYVQSLQDEIGRFAETCGLEPLFRRNKG